ncbi:hypothetical protein CBR_g38381 [Chara braunii]|uniref:PIFI-like Ig-like domain-containing protein n=1 Tax=Chara braunii TaxID=69332 RepID=A0A388JNS0_CHABU|nr:hypothetical protein CBR_g38381 [Chara braunii]|eukprot:GBG59352.1 hypothetical protein CBR_g38381 [Chara braunii]
MAFPIATTSSTSATTLESISQTMGGPALGCHSRRATRTCGESLRTEAVMWGSSSNGTASDVLGAKLSSGRDSSCHVATGRRHLRRMVAVTAMATSTASPSWREQTAQVPQTGGGTTYTLPTWSKFEMGLFPVYWECATGEAPASGESLTVYFNPSASQLTVSESFGIGFNGGFNSPIMCGGQPRTMTRKDRGPDCEPLYSIKINVPRHALSLEFSFTDGKEWDGPYKIQMVVPQQWRNKPAAFFNAGLAEEMSHDDACEQAIFPDSSYVADRCLMPGGLYHEQGAKCELDLVMGCTDPASPFYDPLATVDDGCPLDVDQDGSGI